MARAATELTAGSDGAATEHTEVQQLAELVNQEAGLSTEIELKVMRNDLIDLRKSKVQALLQSTSFPQTPVPTVTIADVLQLNQKTAIRSHGHCGENP